MSFSRQFKSVIGQFKSISQLFIAKKLEKTISRFRNSEQDFYKIQPQVSMGSHNEIFCCISDFEKYQIGIRLDEYQTTR
jgi:hypothetical protein